MQVGSQGSNHEENKENGNEPSVCAGSRSRSARKRNASFASSSLDGSGFLSLCSGRKEKRPRTREQMETSRLLVLVIAKSPEVAAPTESPRSMRFELRGIDRTRTLPGCRSGVSRGFCSGSSKPCARNLQPIEACANRRALFHRSMNTRRPALARKSSQSSTSESLFCCTTRPSAFLCPFHLCSSSKHSYLR